MEITRFGHDSSAIVIAYDPASTFVQPRIIDKTRWLLFDPSLLTALQLQLAPGHRAAELSGSTWSAIVHAPYLLPPYPIQQSNGITIYSFGQPRNRITLLRCSSEPIRLSRLGSAKVITADQRSADWLKQLIAASPRSTHQAIQHFRSHGLTLSSTILRQQFHAVRNPL